MIKQYYYLQLKNSIQIIKKNLICLLCVLSILTVALAAVNFLMEKNINNSFIKVGIVTDEDNAEIKALMRYISHESSIENLASFEYLEHDEAFNKLESNAINIVIDIPKDYYNNIDSGINTPLDIYINDDTDIITMAFVRILYSAQTYIQNSEATVYSILDTYHSGDYILKKNNIRIGDYVALIYADIIIHRFNIFDNKVISSFGELTSIQYFYIAFIFILTIYIVSFFNDLYSSDNQQFEKIIKVYGINISIQSISKQVVIGTFVIPVIIVFHIIVGSLINKFFGDISFGIMFYISFIVINLSIISLYNMLSYILSKTKYKELIIFTLIILMLILSGCIIPNSYFPEILNIVSKIFPFEYARNVVFSGINNSINVISLLICTIYIIFENIVVIICDKY